MDYIFVVFFKEINVKELKLYKSKQINMINHMLILVQ